MADVTVGAAFTVKIEPLVAVLPSPFVTVKVRVPVAAPLAIEMLMLKEVGLFTVVEFTVMPLPEKTVAKALPLTKPVPVTVRF